MARKPISKKIRFEVFKRDNFTCQYCGRKVPEVVLNVDHIKPVAKGGTNDMFNLISACEDCNNGKRDIPLDKQEELEKQRNELEILNERREQLEMLYEWKKALTENSEYELDKLVDYVEQISGKCVLDNGRKKLKKYLKEFTTQELIEAVDISFSQYSDAQVAFNAISGICAIRKKDKENPALPKLRYLLNIANKKYRRRNKDYDLFHYMEYRFHEEDFDDMLFTLNNSRSYSDFVEMVRDYYSEGGPGYGI